MRVSNAYRYIKGKKGNKYWWKKRSTKKCEDVWNGIKNKINATNVSECDYEKIFMKIKFNSDDNLLLNKPLKFHAMTIIIRSVFEEDGKLYPQVFLDDTLYELNI